ncbi:MAG: DUF4091 domain-containing protein [Oscillospiraceae bacterium]|nr:DUF4091 domain-containing protein [Oscillospiraceae bacterium]
MEVRLNTKVVSSLEKVFATKEPEALKTPVTLLQNDFTAFQVAFRLDDEERRSICKVTIDSEIADLITVRQVEQVPVRNVGPNTSDGDWLSEEPGLFPDLLQPARVNGAYIVCNHQWNSFWFEVETKEDTPAGTYDVALSFEIVSLFSKSIVSTRVVVPVTVYGAVLPKQTLKRTEWFHPDCVADYYKVEVFSEEHWKLMEEQAAFAAKRGINMLLTPLFTYPLDVDCAERTTAQLVEVTVENGEYSFGFDLFRRWIDMAKRCGFEYFEMSHLFSQGGAVNATKIMATVDGEYKKIFGPEDLSTSEAYLNFLSKMLPELVAVIKELGIAEKTVFHIADEPPLEKLPTYKTLKEAMMPYIGEFDIIDALSDYDFYQDGVCDHPVVASNHVTPFLEGETPEDFWVYNCVAQWNKVANRFIAMPSYRNRIMAEQLYKYDVDGFLHWGYNFYNAIGSAYKTDPFGSTDCGGGYPAGDPFSVYPGDDGKPWPSIRLEVLWETMCDLRAFKMLESLTDKAYVMSLIEAEGEVTFFDYPRNADYILNLRQKINAEIAARV